MYSVCERERESRLTEQESKLVPVPSVQKAGSNLVPLVQKGFAV
jgi:hypothetical protein